MKAVDIQERTVRLNLRRETLRALSIDDLRNVNGARRPTSSPEMRQA